MTTPWQKRTKRLAYAVGAATSVYLVASYALDRMRQSRIKGLKERKAKDLMKSHFTSLLSTISYTLYALLPTLQPQLYEAYPVESISQALQGLSSSEPSPSASLVLPTPVTGSWASEFNKESPSTQESELHSDETSSVGTSIPTEDDFSTSSPSDLSQSLPPWNRFSDKSKKELWKELKVQTLTRSLTTAYLIPLLYLLTISQLATLARFRYMGDVKAALPQPAPRYSGWFGYWFGEEEDNPTEEIASDEVDDAEREFLSYSWWLLHRGWRGVGERVNRAVEEVFNIPLKRELSTQDWEGLIREVRARVEMDGESLYSFVPHFLPDTVPSDCPLPQNPTGHLATLLTQTKSHLHSADANYLLEKAATAMIKKLVESLGEKNRLVDCLPSVDQWGKAVWEGIPDTGVEAVLAIPEFEAFAALVFGDWA